MKWPKKPRPHDPFQLVFSSVAFARSQWHLQHSLSWQGKGFFFDGMARIVLARGMDGKVALGRASAVCLVMSCCRVSLQLWTW